MNRTLIEISILILLIILNGIFSMAEMAVVSSRKHRLIERAEKGSSGARTALELAGDPNRFLSTVQIGITTIGVLTGAIGGATLADDISPLVASIPSLKPYAEGIAVALVVLGVTYLSLLIGELVPKRLALNNPEGIATRVSHSMKVLSRLTTPLVSLLSASTEVVLRLLRTHPTDEPAVTQDDVRRMIHHGTQIGIFDSAEQDMVTQVFRLGDRRVSTVMTPRTEIVFLDGEDEPEQVLEKIIQSSYSRFPVYIGQIDNIAGIAEVKTLFSKLAHKENLDLLENLQEPYFIPEGMPALDALEQMRLSGAVMALVIDEFGGLVGLVTLNDILEAISGDVELPAAGEEAEVVRRADGSLLLDGRLLTDDLKEILNLSALPDEEKSYYDTLGGLLMSELGRVPEVGETYTWGGYRFEVVDMDGRRVDKVMAMQVED